MDRSCKTGLILALFLILLMDIAIAREDTLWAGDDWSFYTQTSFGSATTQSLNISNDSIAVREGKQLRIHDSADTGFIAFSVPNLSSGSTSYIYPATAGTAGQALSVQSVLGNEVTLNFQTAGASPSFSATTVPSNISLPDNIEIVYVNATSQDVTVTLASATSVPSGKIIWVHLQVASGTRMFITAPEAQTISGTSTVSAGLAGDAYQFYSDGSNWHLYNFEQVLKREMSCTFFNPDVGAPTADNDTGLCASWIDNLAAGPTVGDIEVRIIPGACSKPPVCTCGMTNQDSKRCYNSRVPTGAPSKDFVMFHTFNPGIGNDDEDIDVSCECLK